MHAQTRPSEFQSLKYFVVQKLVLTCKIEIEEQAKDVECVLHSIIPWR